MAARRVPATPPKGVVVGDLTIYPKWSTEKLAYQLQCDLCGLLVDAGQSGHGGRLFGHRGKTGCQQRQAEQALSVVSVPHLHPGELPPRPTGLCPGAPVQWLPGSIWDTFPFQYHGRDSMRWQPSGFDATQNTVFIRSGSCQRVLSGAQSACTACWQVINSAPFHSMMERAANALPSTPYKYLSHSQVADVARQRSDEKKVLRSKYENMIQSQRRWKNRATEYERIVIYISTNDIPRIRWIFSATLKRGSNPERLMSQLIRGAHDAYSPHGFSQQQLVASYLGHAIGGPKLMFALGQVYGVVSKDTVNRRLRIPRLLACITIPTAGDIALNIEAFLRPDIFPVPVSLSSRDPSALPGHVLMFDGIALEPRARYCTLRDKVLGLSRETSGNVDPSASTMDAIDAIRAALQDGRVRFGSEATVVAVATYTDTLNYSPVPLVVSPSDKTEKGPALQEWIARIVECWKQHKYTHVRGPIWSLASDGDAAYRFAKHWFCTVRMLSSRDALWTSLSPLRGLNLQTSADGLTTSTCDPKHIIKRTSSSTAIPESDCSKIGFATLLRNPHGIMIFDGLVLPRDILFHLTTLDMDQQAAVRLLDPADKQKVDDGSIVQTGTLMGFLIRTGTSYALAILQISAFQKPGGERQWSMTMDELEKSAGDFQTKALGQILDLQAPAESAGVWMWTGKYLALDDDATARLTQNRFILHVPTTFLHPVVAQLYENTDAAVQGAIRRTWVFSTSHLTETMCEAWDALEPSSAEILMNITGLPQAANARQLPYRGRDDAPCFVVPRVPEHLVPERKYETGEHLLCRLCDTEVVLEKMRAHVGRHILLKARGLPDPSLGTRAPVGDDPCGFCGRLGCFTVLSIKGKSATIHSSCGYHYRRMKYAVASVSTKSSPCTNVPIHCTLCPRSKSGQKGLTNVRTPL
ncbi:hypothetical protein EXIGLDRAFT_693781 [Exidia glandulosa HHB12029]|uniref:Uncharacterized protein n=1 Tax=Exidia glandulosa HHB12029 TaxID=1314781 RepID=A0A165H127_EXIGL|nr:hypothetical protein EXIGLDRAFT_693781 [Exidia glandulosa HHB12029]